MKMYSANQLFVPSEKSFNAIEVSVPLRLIGNLGFDGGIPRVPTNYKNWITQHNTISITFQWHQLDFLTNMTIPFKDSSTHGQFFGLFD